MATVLSFVFLNPRLRQYVCAVLALQGKATCIRVFGRMSFMAR